MLALCESPPWALVKHEVCVFHVASAVAGGVVAIADLTLYDTDGNKLLSFIAMMKKLRRRM